MQDTQPFTILQQKVYPSLNKALLSLIDHIVKTEEVRKHQQRLIKQKIIDQLEKKRIEREKDKMELGSDYDQSEDEVDYQSLGMQKEQVQKILQARLKARENNQLDQNVPRFPGTIQIFNPISFLAEKLREIKNEDEQQNKQKIRLVDQI